MFKDGGKIIWVAPSGGRDRKDANGEYEVAPFDSKSIEMFRLMADKAGRTTHFYPLSMLTYNVCPPPEQVGGAVGEQRTVKFSPAALHFGEEVDLEEYQVRPQPALSLSSHASLLSRFPPLALPSSRGSLLLLLPLLLPSHH